MTNAARVTGTLSKMRVENRDPSPVAYELRLGSTLVPLNPLLGQNIELRFQGVISCLRCERRIKKSYSQGYCFPCAQRLPETDLCQVRPETCHFAQGTCRDEQWGQAHCFIPHSVYLARSSGVKVGITRTQYQVQRWMDQGASAALPILAVTNRRTAGLVEDHLRAFISDKTNWRTMLKGEQAQVDLTALRDSLLSKLPSDLEYAHTETREHHFTYPVLSYPKTVSAHNLDKEPLFAGKLMGIKGQYLMLEGGRVLNVRKYSGYEVSFTAAL